jgi:hypothetical protein
MNRQEAPSKPLLQESRRKGGWRIAKDAGGPVQPNGPLDRTWLLLPIGYRIDPDKIRSKTNLTRSTLGSNRTSPLDSELMVSGGGDPQ